MATWLQPILQPPHGFNLVSTWFQLVSTKWTLCQHGFNLVSTWFQLVSTKLTKINVASTWFQHGFNMVSTNCQPLPALISYVSTRCRLYGKTHDPVYKPANLHYKQAKSHTLAVAITMYPSHCRQHASVYDQVCHSNTHKLEQAGGMLEYVVTSLSKL